MATIYKRVNGKELDDYLAHLPGVRAGVNEQGVKSQAIAEGIFAPHNRPGGHSIGGGPDGLLDYYIYLDGPNPLAVEYGRAGFVTTKATMIEGRWVAKGTFISAWEGTHVLRKTVELS